MSTTNEHVWLWQVSSVDNYVSEFDKSMFLSQTSSENSNLNLVRWVTANEAHDAHYFGITATRPWQTLASRRGREGNCFLLVSAFPLCKPLKSVPTQKVSVVLTDGTPDTIGVNRYGKRNEIKAAGTTRKGML